MEHGYSKAITPKRDAAVMSRFTCRIDDVPSRAEMVAMMVEAHASRWLLFRAQRDQKLELERLLHLADRLHLTNAAEERIARIIDLEGQAEIARDGLSAHHPALAKIGNVVRA